MEERLPSQVYVVGYSLLLLTVALAIVMMSRTLALNPGEFGAATEEERFERAAGLDPLGTSGVPELRIWFTADDEAPVTGVVVTPSAITRYELAARKGWGTRYDVTRNVRETGPAAVQAVRLMSRLADSDSHYLVCGSETRSVSVAGSVAGRDFHFREAGDCSGVRAPVADELFRLIASKN